MKIGRRQGEGAWVVVVVNVIEAVGQNVMVTRERGYWVVEVVRVVEVVGQKDMGCEDWLSPGRGCMGL